MCGIFGLTFQKKDDLNFDIYQKTVKELFLLSESRGKEASGLAIDAQDEIVIYKNPFSASEFIKHNSFKKIISPEHFTGTHNRIALIGHSRLVTHGYEHFNHNNQPVVRDGIVGIHNGIVVNYQEVWMEMTETHRISELDSEVIFAGIRHYLNDRGDLGRALSGLFRKIYGMTSIACFMSDYNNLILATNNGSIYYAFSSDRTKFIFASERYILQTLIRTISSLNITESDIVQLRPNSTCIINLNTLSANVFSFSVPPLDAVPQIEFRQPLAIKEIENTDKAIKTIYINKSLEHGPVDIPQTFNDHYEQCRSKINNLRRCTKCILPETFPFIDFDENGICNYCRNYNKKVLKGETSLSELFDDHRSRNGTADCLVPFSGGRDSSYVLHLLKTKYKMNPIAFSYDWGMITDLARRNQARLCGKLGVEHIYVSADIRAKRNNIHKNVSAWLKKPSLGTIPLFMAGDKQYFYFANRLMKHNHLQLSILGENHLETTNFKSGFCGIKPQFDKQHTYSLSTLDKIKMLLFYGQEFLSNPRYLNSSLLDSFDAFKSYYIIRHNNVNIYDYIPWDETLIEKTLKDEYDWETDPGTSTTWRIGDGTAAFYNYIYYIVAGFSEIDTFRSNQIREGLLSRDVAMDKAAKENQPRFESIKWYLDTIHLPFEETIRCINQIFKFYQP